LAWLALATMIHVMDIFILLCKSDYLGKNG